MQDIYKAPPTNERKTKPHQPRATPDYNNLPDNKARVQHIVHPDERLSGEATEMFWNSIRRRLESTEGQLMYHQSRLSSTLIESNNILLKFVEGNNINEAFFKKNFLQVDIFYKSLTDKSIIQQRAYEYPTLLGKWLILIRIDL